MKILFANRKDCFSVFGGDTLQMEKTKEYLEKLFPEVQIKTVLSPDEILKDKEAEIVHIFNITTSFEAIGFLKAAKQANKKIVISPIFCNSIDSIYLTYLSFLGIFGLKAPLFFKKAFIVLFNILIILFSPFIKRCANYAKNGLYLFPKNKKIGKEILEKSDFILPNSDKELERAEEYYGFSIKNKAKIIPNATDFFNSEKKEEGLEFTLPENYILEVGRIEFMKNQLNLVKALADNPEIPIVFVGRKFNNKYNNSLKSLAKKRGNVYLFDEIPHNILPEIYKKAKVHVLPSYIETTGLVSIEAKAFGAQIVTSDENHCPVKYYKFDELGFLCNPYDIKTIKEAVLQAYYKPKQKEIDEEYKQFFSYENVARKTYEVYSELLGRE